jgi:hypothetical protein
VQNVQQRQPVELLTEADVDQAFTDAAKIYKKYILKAMDTKVTRRDVETMLSYQADSAINKFQSAHGEPFNLLCGALRVMFQDVKESK